MARPANQPRKRPNPSFSIPEGLVAKEIRLEPPGDGLERKHRIWKDKVSFLINDVLASLLAALILIGIIGFSFWSLARLNLDKDERQFALSILSCSGTAVVGFVFGKA